MQGRGSPAPLAGALALAGVRRRAPGAADGGGSTAQPGRLLRPRAGQQERHRRLRQDRRRQGRHVQGVLRRLRRPEPRRRSAARRPTSCTSRSSPTCTRLVDAGPRRRRLEGQRRPRASCTQSVVVIVVRKGNPKDIKTWDDLVKPGVGIVTPNPASSGSARWNILAAYGHVLADGGTEADAEAYLKKFFGNVVALPGSGRDATTAFPAAPATCCCPTRTRRSSPGRAARTSTTSSRTTTLLIENPGAVTDGRRPEGARSSWTSSSSDEGQKLTPRRASARSIDGVDVEVEGANDPSDPFPTPDEAAHHRRGLRRLGRGQHEVLRRERRHRHQDPGRDRASRVTPSRPPSPRGPAGAHAPVGPAGSL